MRGEWKYIKDVIEKMVYILYIAYREDDIFGI